MPSQSPQAGLTLLDIDLALAQIGDVEAMNDMLAMLEESLVRDIPEISALLEKGDGLGANRLLHALKGFIPIFCQPALCLEVARVEGISKHIGHADVAPAYAALRPQLEQLRAEVSNQLMARGAPL